MQFDERWVGEYRIFTGALESPIGDGYTAAIVVHVHGRTDAAPREIFRDEGLACGHRWESAEAALAYALTKAQQMVQNHAALPSEAATRARAAPASLLT